MESKTVALFFFFFVSCCNVCICDTSAVIANAHMHVLNSFTQYHLELQRCNVARRKQTTARRETFFFVGDSHTAEEWLHSIGRLLFGSV